MGDYDRFDKFTERARKILSLAQEEAQRFQHNSIGVEHLLIGLVREREGIASRVLEQGGVDLQKVRNVVERLVGRGDRIVLGEIVLTQEAQKAIELAIDEAQHLKRSYIGTEHLLLGLVDLSADNETFTSRLFRELGVVPEALRTSSLQIISTALSAHPSASSKAEVTDEARKASGQQPQPGRFDKFTEQARKALSFAQEEGARFQHNYIGTEHLLLGLIREQKGVAVEVLLDLGVDIQKVRETVEMIISREDRVVQGNIGLTPRSKKVIELAVDEARRLDHSYIGTEHILLGLVREGEGIAAGVLEDFGVERGNVREAILRILRERETKSGEQEVE